MILTEKEIQELSDLIERSDFFDVVVPFARAIEAAILKKIGGPVAWHHEATRQLIAERENCIAALTESTKLSDNLYSKGRRLALELECLLLDTKDTAIQSKWWDSAHEALEDWRK